MQVPLKFQLFEQQRDDDISYSVLFIEKCSFLYENSTHAENLLAVYTKCALDIIIFKIEPDERSLLDM